MEEFEKKMEGEVEGTRNGMFWGVQGGPLRTCYKSNPGLI